MIISKGKKWNRRENDRRTSSFCRNGRIDFGEALDDGEDSFDDLVFASYRFGRSHSFPVAWKWECRRLEVPKTIRDLFISQTLSLSKKIWTKIKRVRSWNFHFVGNWLEWVMRGGAVERGQGLVREFEREKVFQFGGFWWFGGFEDLGVLKFLFDDWNLKFWENSNLLGFSFKFLFTIWGFSFSEILGAHQVSSRARRYWIFFMLITKVFMAIEIARLKKYIFQRLLSKVVSNIIFYFFYFLCLFQRFY